MSVLVCLPATNSTPCLQPINECHDFDKTSTNATRGCVVNATSYGSTTPQVSVEPTESWSLGDYNHNVVVFGTMVLIVICLALVVSVIILCKSRQNQKEMRESPGFKVTRSAVHYAENEALAPVSTIGTYSDSDEESVFTGQSRDQESLISTTDA